MKLVFDLEAFCYDKDMKTVAKRLHDGQDLLEEINGFVKDESILAGVILSAVGSLKTSKIRVPIINGQVKYLSPKNLEIDNLHGTVSINGCHLHISVSDIDGKVTGGHLKEGCIIRTTCELVIGILDDASFNRELDKNTGFDELVIS
jgi:predicted DNA-binding protein with PD1-like motif